MQQSTLLIVNSTATYVRIAFNIVISFLVLRLLLDTLGQSDYGLYVLLGAGLSLTLVIEGALTMSAQRHLAYEIGRGDRQSIDTCFATACVMYTVSGVVALLIGALVGPPLMAVLTIPPGREVAGYWVYYSLLLSMVFIIWNSPWMGLLFARQEIILVSVVDITYAVGKLGVVLLLYVLPGDRLIWFGLLTGVLTMLVMLLRTFWCMARFEEAWPKLRLYRRGLLRELFSYAVWTFLAALTVRARIQGSNLILNLFHGTLLNAGWGVAIQVQGAQYLLSLGINRAALPAATTIEGAGKRDASLRLADATSRLCTLASVLILVPFSVEASYVLVMWLKDPPPFSSPFCVWLMIGATLTQLSRGEQNVIYAIGRIRGFSLILNGLMLVSLAASVAVLAVGCSPEWVAIVAAIGSLAETLFSIAWAKRLTGHGLGHWMVKVAIPVTVCTLSSLAAAAFWRLVMDPSLWRLTLVTGSSTLILGLLGWQIGMSDEERQHLRRLAGRLMQFARRSQAESEGS
ncbi:MAG: hypothetical protein IT445_04430 [Phycisphaeraceae bacterium]|nr:hypothetical protein [Phycisphaeraceae bacterium]